MQTQRLSTLSSPSHTGALLESCARGLGVLPADAQPVHETWRLPMHLLEAAERAEHDGEIWRAWSSGEAAWLIVGHLAIENARERGQPVLQLQCYEHARRGRNSLVATRTPDGTWLACGA